IMHRRHHVGPHAEHGEEQQQRHRCGGKQHQREHEADRARSIGIVGGERANELVGVHPHCSRSLAVRLESARCSATRTAPSLIANFFAVSLIEALSTAIDCSTSRWRAGSVLSWAVTSVAEAVSALGSSDSVSAKSSILTNTRLPRRRSASINL